MKTPTKTKTTKKFVVRYKILDEIYYNQKRGDIVCLQIEAKGPVLAMNKLNKYMEGSEHPCYQIESVDRVIELI